MAYAFLMVALEISSGGLTLRAGQKLSGKVHVNVLGCPVRGGQLNFEITGTEECWVNLIRYASSLQVCERTPTMV